MRPKLWLVVILSVVALSGIGCDDNSGPTLPPTTGQGGFFISTFTSFNLSPPVVSPVTTISGRWVADLAGAQGDASPWTTTTNSAGVGIVGNGRAPADWKFTWVFSLVAPCEGQTVTTPVHFRDDDVGLVCTIIEETGLASASTTSDFAFAPNPVYTSAPASAGIITGSGIDATYGMPLVQYYTLDGTLAAQQNAVWVSSDGTALEISGGDISQLPGGTYAGFINNANPDGSLNPIGSVAVEVADGSVMIGGSEQSTQVDPCFEYGTEYNPCPYWVDDMGTVSITVNGLTKTVGYWSLDNVDGFLRYDGLYYYNQATSIASGLANAFNADPASPVVASVQGSMIFFTSKTPGAGVNYGLSTAVSYNDTDFSSSSFTATASGPTL